MRKSFWIIGGIVILIGVLLMLFTMQTEDRPYEFAQAVSNLDLPDNIQLIEFKEDRIEFNGSGFALAVYQLTEEHMTDLSQQAQKAGFKELPINNLIADDFALNYINQAKQGLYLKKSPNPANILSYSLTVIDQTNRRLIVFDSAS